MVSHNIKFWYATKTGYPIAVTKMNLQCVKVVGHALTPYTHALIAYTLQMLVVLLTFLFC